MLKFLLHILKMQREIDINEFFLKRLFGYLHHSGFADIENEPLFEGGYALQENLRTKVFQFLRWMIQNHKDVLEEYQKTFGATR